jgi:hypothetical protein
MERIGFTRAISVQGVECDENSPWVKEEVDMMKQYYGLVIELACARCGFYKLALAISATLS